MPNKIKISAALATYNEEENIVDCLKSLQQFSNEIIIVDGYSKDRTVELAEKLGATVIQKKNETMININKNYAIKSCHFDWVFLIDADERVSKQLAKEIRKTIEDKPKENGFWVNRKNWFLGGYLTKGGAYPDPVIRLFKKNKAEFAENDVHEIIQIDGKVGKLGSELLHLADPNFKRYLERADRYTSRSAENIMKKDPGIGLFTVLNYMLAKPFFTFISIYFRHKGYQDGFRGFIWAIFSAFHYYYAYIKYWEKKSESSN